MLTSCEQPFVSSHAHLDTGADTVSTDCGMKNQKTRDRTLALCSFTANGHAIRSREALLIGASALVSWAGSSKSSLLMV